MLYWATIWFSALYLVTLIQPFESRKAWNYLDIPNPKLSPKQCNSDRSGYLCDPENLLTTSTRHKLQRVVLNFPLGMPCFCRSGCSMRNDARKRLNIGILIISDIAGLHNETAPRNRMKKMREFANMVQIRWKMSDCNGNDALILVMNGRKPLVFVSYGLAVLRKLNRRCRRDIERQFYRRGRTDLFIGLSRLISRIKGNVRRCSCGNCPSNYSWYRLIAWVFFCVFLLSCLSFFGRRLWLRQSINQNSSFFFAWDQRQSNHRTSSFRHQRSSASSSVGGGLQTRSMSPRRTTPRTMAVGLSLRDPPVSVRRASPTLDRDLGSLQNTTNMATPPAYSTLTDDSILPPPYPGVAKQPPPSPRGTDNHSESLGSPPPYTAQPPPENRESQ